VRSASHNSPQRERAEEKKGKRRSEARSGAGGKRNWIRANREGKRRRPGGENELPKGKKPEANRGQTERNSGNVKEPNRRRSRKGDHLQWGMAREKIEAENRHPKWKESVRRNQPEE